MTPIWLWLALAILLLPRAARRHHSSPEQRRSSGPPFHALGALAVGLAVLVTVPTPWSLVLAGGVAGTAWYMLPRTFSHNEEEQRMALGRSLPGAVDLLGAVLRIGMSDTAALALVAGAVDEPLRGHLQTVARHRRLGAEPARAWRVVCDVAALDDLAAAMVRHAESGTPVVTVLERVAADARRDHHTRSQSAARAAAVRAVVPLAVCFLPAFMALGVVPIVASLMADLSF